MWLFLIYTSVILSPSLTQGKIGVNTDSPEEALTVVGNVQVTGQILQPSDVRLKTDIMKVSKSLPRVTWLLFFTACLPQMNTAQMLDNISKLNLYHYRFKNGTDGGMGTQQGTGRWGRGEVGLLAQEVETVIPEAVHHAVSQWSRL